MAFGGMREMDGGGSTQAQDELRARMFLAQQLRRQGESVPQVPTTSELRLGQLSNVGLQDLFNQADELGHQGNQAAAQAALLLQGLLSQRTNPGRPAAGQAPQTQRQRGLSLIEALQTRPH